MTGTSTMSHTFPLGQLVITTNAADTLHPADVAAAVRRHARGDWGELCDQDRAQNELALKEGFRLMSVYRDRYQQRFYIITEADRQTTTCLLPADY